MRLGGPVFEKCGNPQEWVSAVKRLGYSAAYCPIEGDADDATVAAYAKAAADADIVIAEVGAWSNPISDNESECHKALSLCKRQLALAEGIGANCCVNIAGARGPKWDGPDEKNFTDETFERIVDSVQEIIDAVKPARTFYTLEPMPWIPPDSPESYLELIRAIDRPQFAVHFDPVNIITSPRRYFLSGDFLRECFRLLGGQMKSIHAKDSLMAEGFTTHLDEVAAGKGKLDYATFLQEIERTDPNLPLMLEHLKTAEEFKAAADYVRSVAQQVGVTIKA